MLSAIAAAEDVCQLEGQPGAFLLALTVELLRELSELRHRLAWLLRQRQLLASVSALCVADDRFVHWTGIRASAHLLIFL